MLNLKKSEIVERVGLNLKKKALDVPPACNVNVFLDISGSFKDEWEAGLVAQVMSRAMAVASRLDDDGNVPLFLFHNSVTPRGVVSFADMPEDSSQMKAWLYQKAGNFKYGGTEFAPVIRAMLPTTQVVTEGGFMGMFGKKKTVEAQSMVQQAADPRLVYVITDGDAGDYREARELCKTLQDHRTYVMFINVSELAQCAVRLSEEFSHVGHVFFKNLNQVTDEQMIEAMLTPEFLQWRKQMG